MIRPVLAAAALALAAPLAQAQSVTHTVEDNFDDVAFAIENAIVSQGLVIDFVSHVGDMLERTREDMGSPVTIFTDARVFTFCSAATSRRVMEADPMNLQFCPYGIFVMEQPETPGQVVVGYREYPEGPMKEVEEMLGKIVADALGLD
ncbi:MAG: DUF302 domain-containing protein [Gemmobacter sp.]